MKVFRLIRTGLIAAFLALVLTNQSLADTYVWLKVGPPSISPVPGSVFTTDLTVSSWNGAAAALDLAVRYDPAVLQIVDFSIPSDSEFYANCFADSASYTSGKTSIACFQVTKREAQDPPVSFGTLTWKVVGTAGSFTDVSIETTTVVAADWSSLEVLVGGQRITISLFGDLDGDCDVDIVDIMLVASRWGSRVGDVKYDSRYDLDQDADIDIVDIMRVAMHWDERCARMGP